jgi:hypothetical protein
VVIFTVIHPVGLVGSILWRMIRKRRRGGVGAIALPEEDEERNGERGAREVREEEVWE